MLKTTGSSAASASGADGNEAVGGGADGDIGGNRIAAPLTAMLKTGSSAASASGADGDEVTGGGADGGVGRSGGSGSSKEKSAKSKKLQLSKIQNIGYTRKNLASETQQRSRLRLAEAHDAELLAVFQAFKSRRHYQEGYKHEVLVLTFLITRNSEQLPSFVGYCHPFRPQPFGTQPRLRRAISAELKTLSLDVSFRIDYPQGTTGAVNASSFRTSAFPILSLFGISSTLIISLTPLHKVLICETHVATLHLALGQTGNGLILSEDLDPTFPTKSSTITYFSVSLLEQDTLGRGGCIRVFANALQLEFRARLLRLILIIIIIISPVEAGVTSLESLTWLSMPGARKYMRKTTWKSYVAIDAGRSKVYKEGLLPDTSSRSQRIFCSYTGLRRGTPTSSNSQRIFCGHTGLRRRTTYRSTPSRASGGNGDSTCSDVILSEGHWWEPQ
ncbi:hypothetical protein MMC31_007585 [Peltigera leucophlebia]|nr:hypothetical protein [Peltigera leucophlebia]